MARVLRKNKDLNDAIEYLDHILISCDNNIADAYARLEPDDYEFIEEETLKCMDLRYYLENYHCIKDAHQNFRALYNWWDHQEIVYEAIQEEWKNNDYCKIIILKPRQTGISTWIAAAMFHKAIFSTHSLTMLIAQNKKTSGHVYKMSMNAYDALPWWLRPEYLYKTKGDQIEFQRLDENERLVNPGLGSVIQCSNAQEMSGIAIGQTITNLHMSEVSRYPPSDIFQADIEPSTRGTRNPFNVMESTGLGRNGLFYEWWTGAVEGDNDWRALFIPVYKVKRYYIMPRGEFLLTTDEKSFNARALKEEKFEIPDSFWNFRRKGLRAAARGDGRAGFLESYPITPTEAFQASGICAFDRRTIEEQTLRYMCKPIWAGEIFLAADNKTPNTDAISEVDDEEILPKRKGSRPSKRLHIWKWVELGRTYYVSSDTGLGVDGGDYSVCFVWLAGEGSEPDEIVANWWGHIPPQQFARINVALGYMYNDAEIATEYQGPGITTGDKLIELDYPALYRERMKDRPGGAYKPFFHFVTNVRTRESIIATMNEALLTHNRNDEPGVIIHCEELLDEMIDFGSTGGRMEGQGNHDDGVMGAQIGLYCMRETTVHLKGAANDDRDRPHAGDINLYGVFDNVQRQRGQYQDRALAEDVVKDKPGWFVQPVLICKANTEWSPIYDGTGPERRLRFEYGMQPDEITPSMVSAFRDSMKEVANAGGGNNDPDW